MFDNKADGHGVLHYNRGCQFSGEWENGYERIGCYMWPNNVQYFGTWENGYRHGTGVEKHQTYVYKVGIEILSLPNSTLIPFSNMFPLKQF